MSIDTSSLSSSLEGNTLVILLGTAEASSDRSSMELREPRADFSLHVNKVQEYFLQTYKLDEKNILNLLDGDRSTTYPEEEIKHFLRTWSRKLQQRRNFIQNIIIYCIGHYVISSSDIVLQLRYTRELHRHTPELRFETLAQLLHTNMLGLPSTCRILLLDGYLHETNSTDFTPLPITITKYIERAFAHTENQTREQSDNTVLLFASQILSRRMKGKDTHELSPFLFTDALLYALTYGDGLIPKDRFSLNALDSLIGNFLLQKYPDTPIQPTLITIGPQSGKTNILEEPIFPNTRRQQSIAPRKSIRLDLKQPLTIIKEKLTDNLFVRETSTVNLSPANIVRLQELNLIPLERPLTPDSRLVSQKKLYLYERHQRKISAIDMITGITNWSYKQQQSIDPEPSISDDLMYIRTDERTLLCLETNTGSTHWYYTAKDAYKLQDTFLIVDGVIYAFFSNDREDTQNHKTSIRAIDKETGRVIWEIIMKQVIAHPLRATTGYLFIRTNDNHFHCMEMIEPWKNWTFAPSNASISFDPVTVKDLVYLVTDQYSSGSGSTLHALELSTGKERWQYKSFTDLRDIKYVPVVYDDFIYVVIHHNTDHHKKQTVPEQIHAINKNTGRVHWSYTFTKPIAYCPVIIHNLLSIITWGNAQKESQLSILETTETTRDRLLKTIPFITQKTLFTPIQKGAICYAPIIDNDMLYITCILQSEQGDDEKRHAIYAVHVPSGSIRWETPLKGLLLNEPTIVHSLMYVLVRGKANEKQLIVLSTATGKQCWEYTKVDVPSYPPIVTGNLLCLVTTNPRCLRIFHLPED